MIRRGRFERHRRLPRLHGGKLALLIACLIQTALSVFSFAMLGKVTGALITQSAADVWRGGSGERFAQVSAFLPVNGMIDLDTIRSFRVTLEDEFGIQIDTDGVKLDTAGDFADLVEGLVKKA